MSSGHGEANGGLIGWFAQNSIAANVLMIALMVGGWITVTRTNSDLFPDIDPRTITVSVPYAGATPDEIESSITRRVEEAILGLEGVDLIRSTALESVGTVTIELTDFADAQSVANDVQAAVDGLVDFPPEDAEEAEVSITSFVSNVIRLVVAGDVDELALRRAAEHLESELLVLPDVSSVTLQGARKYEISIEVPQATLRRYNLSLDRVANAIRSASVSVPGGTLETASGTILLRTDEQVQDANEYASIVVLSDFEGRRVLLGDIAQIRDGFQESPLINTYNGQSAVFLQVARGADRDSITIADTVKDFLQNYSPPPGITVHVASDQTDVIRDRINLLLRNAIMGLALVFVFLALTLDLRLAFWTCLGIPVAFLGGFILFGQLTTINMTMLLGMIMVLGLVVDDAIVVGENIYDEQEKTGPGVGSAIRGASAVAAPVVIGVMTTMAVFAPLLLSSGMLGQLLRPVPLVAIAVLFVSLNEVFLILPSHMAHGGDWTVGPMKDLADGVRYGLTWLRDRLVMPSARLSVRMPYFIIASGLSILIIAIGVVGGGHIRFVFFPVVEGEEITATLEMPAGASFDQTERAMNRVVDAAYRAIGGRDSGLYQSLSVTIGGSLVAGFGIDGTQVNAEVATAVLELTPAGERDRSAADVERDWRAAIGELAGVRKLTFVSEGLSGGDDIAYNLSHPDDETLFSAAGDLADFLDRTDGVSEVESTDQLGSRQLEFSLTPIGAAAGLSVNDIARQVRQAFYGEEIQRIQRGSEEVPVFVRLPKRERRSVLDLARLRIQLPNGEDADLPTVARVEETRSVVSIDRYDSRRILAVTADVDEAITTPNAVTEFLNDVAIPGLEARYPGLRISEGGQTREQAEDLAVLASNLMIGVMIMYILLSVQLRSYVQPLIILYAIPFGAVGAVAGHLVLGYDLTFLSLFGMVALAGVVVNDSVVLIDYFNQLQQSGQGSRAQNILTAVERRFRPILITTLTTFLGLLPMIAETSVQAQFLIPMAVSVGFGILGASAVTLILVPACLAVGLGPNRKTESSASTGNA